MVSLPLSKPHLAVGARLQPQSERPIPSRKVRPLRAMIGATRVTLCGIIKGSGMIAPDMATMLGYIFTDAAVEPRFLQEMLDRANAETFSCITVDGDTSTSDTVMAFATGKAGHWLWRNGTTMERTRSTPHCSPSVASWHSLWCETERVRRKFIEIAVTGAETDQSARRVGLSIANSPLVKTAIAGGDANWGRVVMAVGKAGEPADRDRLSIGFGGTWAARDGQPVPDYDETPVARHLAGDEVRIEVDLGIGDGRATVWTCDLTHGYISINADYRS